MNAERHEVAIRAVTETRRMLDLVLAPPNSFDYHLAKRAIGELQAKIRVLTRIWVEPPEAEPEPHATPSFTVVPDPDECA